jgi:hypothetical protein
MALLKVSDIVSLIDSLAEAKIEQYQDFSTTSIKSYDDLLLLMQIKTQLDLLDALLQLIDMLQDLQLADQDIKNLYDRIRTRMTTRDSGQTSSYSKLDAILTKMGI